MKNIVRQTREATEICFLGVIFMGSVFASVGQFV